jgi:hypothetical protein
MLLADFLLKLKTQPDTISFQETIEIIDRHYHFTPTAFTNGELNNQAGQNSGSCKLFSFAKLHLLSKEETLNCFGDYYRKDVIEHPQASDHQNIRNFIQYGWEGVVFAAPALTAQ